MVVRVAQRAARAEGVDEVAVATDDDRIAHEVTRAGFKAVMTPANCRNGTERVAQAAREVEAGGYLNVQGDEPLVDAHAITELARLVRNGAGMATVARHLEPGEENLTQVVKVVLDRKGHALYFSRSLIPYPRSPDEVRPLAHIGLYGFNAAVLERFAGLPETNLERAEGLEQLRALWYGIPIEVGVGKFRSVSVDTPEDLARVRRLYEEEQRRIG